MDKEREIQQGKNTANVAKVRRIYNRIGANDLILIGTKRSASDVEQPSLRLEE
jgi:hypothetical protein